jgi:GT2 family glycosyltransferase
MESDEFPSASVIVVGYNSREYLQRCFDGLLRQRYPAQVELLFVDNASSDRSSEFVRDTFPSVVVIDSGGNLGYAAGNNLGAQHAQGAVVAFLNPDTEPTADWLVELVRPLVADSSIGLTTSRIVHMHDPERINTCGNELSLSGITTCRRANEPSALVERDEDVTAVSGAAFATWAWLFRDLDRFDESFWMYLEDTDLSWRARRAGFRCVLAARSVVSHEYEFTLPPRKTLLVERNRYRMLAKNLRLRTIIALMPLLCLSELLTWGWAGLRGRRHVAAKAQATWWCISHLRLLRQINRAGNLSPAISDARLLRSHSGIPAIASVADGVVGHVIAAFITPLAVLLTLTAFMLVRESAPAATTTRQSRGSDAYRSHQRDIPAVLRRNG